MIDLGTRPIRTAGKGSGSVEVTLPADLRPMVGLPCRIILHDGAQPDIVLRPDFTRARESFAQLWAFCAPSLLRAAGEAANPAWPEGAFSFGLYPQQASAEAPALAWSDGLALAAPTPEPNCIGRICASFASVLAEHCCVTPGLAHGFAAVIGYYISGTHAFPDWTEPSDIAASSKCAASLAHAGHAIAGEPNWRATMLWAKLEPGFREIASAFAQWSHASDEYLLLRAAWRRGRAIALTQG